MSEQRVKLRQPGGALVEGWDVQVKESTERWTEVTLEDGTVLRVKPTIFGAIRLEGKWDPLGNPLYALKAGPGVSAIVSCPDHLKKPGTVPAGKKAN